MAIVKMKRIRLIAMAEDKDALMGALLHAGCVELSEPAPAPRTRAGGSCSGGTPPAWRRPGRGRGS